eukprot:Awhi_evm1s13553
MNSNNAAYDYSSYNSYHQYGGGAATPVAATATTATTAVTASTAPYLQGMTSEQIKDYYNNYYAQQKQAAAPAASDVNGPVAPTAQAQDPSALNPSQQTSANAAYYGQMYSTPSAQNPTAQPALSSFDQASATAYSGAQSNNYSQASTTSYPNQYQSASTASASAPGYSQASDQATEYSQANAGPYSQTAAAASSYAPPSQTAAASAYSSFYSQPNVTVPPASTSSVGYGKNLGVPAGAGPLSSVTTATTSSTPAMPVPRPGASSEEIKEMYNSYYASLRAPAENAGLPATPAGAPTATSNEAPPPQQRNNFQSQAPNYFQNNGYREGPPPGPKHQQTGPDSFTNHLNSPASGPPSRHPNQLSDYRNDTMERGMSRDRGVERDRGPSRDRGNLPGRPGFGRPHDRSDYNDRPGKSNPEPRREPGFSSEDIFSRPRGSGPPPPAAQRPAGSGPPTFVAPAKPLDDGRVPRDLDPRRDPRHRGGQEEGGHRRGGSDFERRGSEFDRRHPAGGDPHFDRRGGDDPNFDRRGGDPHFDRRGGDDPNLDRRGGDPNFNRRGGDPHFDRRGGDPNFDRRGGDPHFDRRGGDPHFDRRGGDPHFDRRGLDRRVGDPNFDRRGGDPNFDRRAGDPNIDRRDFNRRDQDDRRGSDSRNGHNRDFDRFPDRRPDMAARNDRHRDRDRSTDRSRERPRNFPPQDLAQRRSSGGRDMGPNNGGRTGGGKKAFAATQLPVFSLDTRGDRQKKKKNKNKGKEQGGNTVNKKLSDIKPGSGPIKGPGSITNPVIVSEETKSTATAATSDKEVKVCNKKCMFLYRIYREVEERRQFKGKARTSHFWDVVQREFLRQTGTRIGYHAALKTCRYIFNNQTCRCFKKTPPPTTKKAK